METQKSSYHFTENQIINVVDSRGVTHIFVGKEYAFNNVNGVVTVREERTITSPDYPEMAPIIAARAVAVFTDPISVRLEFE